ncbi:hypothetical protein [Paraburkholderia sp. J7]|uniref:hypothetical protein n=1 Tax=Paraburkholderia sp. J7 TaxID=2805438 RepID=UPI002AB6B24D|nr:hypothetical protein [Paraburkholderia sp. J7]
MSERLGEGTDQRLFLADYCLMRRPKEIRLVVRFGRGKLSRQPYLVQHGPMTQEA